VKKKGWRGEITEQRYTGQKDKAGRRKRKPRCRFSPTNQPKRQQLNAVLSG